VALSMRGEPPVPAVGSTSVSMVPIRMCG
jgi:hypothetical protein